MAREKKPIPISANFDQGHTAYPGEESLDNIEALEKAFAADPGDTQTAVELVRTYLDAADAARNDKCYLQAEQNLDRARYYAVAGNLMRAFGDKLKSRVENFTMVGDESISPQRIRGNAPQYANAKDLKPAQYFQSLDIRQITRELRPFESHEELHADYFNTAFEKRLQQGMNLLEAGDLTAAAEHFKNMKRNYILSPRLEAAYKKACGITESEEKPALMRPPAEPRMPVSAEFYLDETSPPEVALH